VKGSTVWNYRVYGANRKKQKKEVRGMKRVLCLMVLVLAVMGGVPVAYADQQSGLTMGPPHVLVVGWDGARPMDVLQFAAEGVLETVTYILDQGTFAEDGVIPVIPANTGAAWPGILAGAGSGVVGITNNAFHDVRSPINEGLWSRPDLIEAETLPQVTLKHGLRTAVLGGAFANWPPADAKLTGPVIGWGNWYSKPFVISNYDIEGAELAPYIWLEYRKVSFGPAKNVPATLHSFSPPMSVPLEITTYTGQTLSWAAVAIDSTNDGHVNYDRVIFVQGGEDGNPNVAGSVSPGEWAALEACINDRRVGLYVKLLDLSPDLERLRIYGTAIQGPQAFPTWLEEEISRTLPIPVTASRDALIGGFVDEETFLEQALMALDWREQAYRFVIEQTQPDVVFAWFEEPDEMLHRMLGYLNPQSAFYDQALAPYRMHMIRQIYMALDKATGELWKTMGGPKRCTLFITSDHGFASFDRIANVNEVLAEAGLYNADNPANSAAVAYCAGGTAQIYINLKGREPGGVVEESEYESVRDRIVNLLESWVDEDGQPVLARVLRREDTKEIKVEGRMLNMYHPYRTGDVVAFAAAPYQFDAAMPGKAISSTIPYFTGQHGYLPGTVPPERGNMRALFAACGPGIRPGAEVPSTAASIDLAPTIAALLGLPAPANAEGIVLDALLSVGDAVPAEEGMK